MLKTREAVGEESRVAAWKLFVEEGILDPSVPDFVSESWVRCRKLQVNHQDGTGRVPSSQDVKQLLEKNQFLLEIARPIMKNLLNLVIESHFALVLTDASGQILEAIGDQIVRDRANNIRFIQGSVWTEEAVGTNAIGTSLAIDRPVQVVGAEHYCVSHHLWTCSAVPIHGVDGQIVGCLNMSGDYREAYSHTLGIVVAAAFSIEKQLELLHSYKMVEATFESTTDGLIIVDRQLRITRVNQGALKIMGIGAKAVAELNFFGLFRDLNLESINELFDKRKPAYFLDFTLHVQGRRIGCSLSMIPIMMDNEVTGFSLGLKELKYLHKTVNKITGNVASYTFDHIITYDETMWELIRLGKRMAQNRSCVLIEGESGTGKELFAHALHNASPRAKGPFVAVNCASLPRDLIESELFGYEKGAFTGALKEGNPGKFELADGGTLFLDEIGELPLELQAKLLRVVENLKVRRIGGSYEKELDVRIIAATNRSLLEEVNKKNFREDLYFRLNVLKLSIPPLRERKNDIRGCAEFFLKRLNQEHDQEAKSFSPELIEQLEKNPWYGNVRELQNLIERAYCLCEDQVIRPDAAWNREPVPVFSPVVPANGLVSVENAMRYNIVTALKQCEGDVEKAAEQMNMSRASLYRRMKKYNISAAKLKAKAPLS